MQKRNAFTENSKCKSSFHCRDPGPIPSVPRGLCSSSSWHNIRNKRHSPLPPNDVINVISIHVVCLTCFSHHSPPVCLYYLWHLHFCVCLLFSILSLHLSHSLVPCFCSASQWDLWPSCFIAWLYCFVCRFSFSFFKGFRSCFCKHAHETSFAAKWSFQ